MMTRERCRRIVLFLTFVILAAELASAQGLQTLGVSIGSGARALGMGGAFIAIADDATASSWNPAGLCVLTQPEVSVVWKAGSTTDIGIAAVNHAFVDPANNFGSEGRISEYSITSTGSDFDFAGVTYPFTLGSFRLIPQFNYQRVIDYGFDQQTDKPITRIFTDHSDDAGNQFTEHEAIRFVTHGGLDVWAASLGIPVHPKLYFGMALNWWANRATVDGFRQEESLFCSPDECVHGRFEFETFSVQHFDGFNFNVGALWKPRDKIAVGFVYKSPFTMKYRITTDGKSLSSVGSANSVLTEIYEEKGEIDWPRTVGFGVALSPKETLTLSADYTWTAWSSAQYRYHFDYHATDEFGYYQDTGDRKVIWPAYFDPAVPQTPFNQEQQDTAQLRSGMEYVWITKFIIALRAGVYADRQYIKDGGGDKIYNKGLTFGIGFVRSSFTVDFALVRETADVTGCDYTFTGEEGAGTEICKSDRKDTFSSHRMYLSTIYRF